MKRKRGKKRPWEETLAILILAILGLVAWVASHTHAAWSRAPLPPVARFVGIVVVLVLGVILARYVLGSTGTMKSEPNAAVARGD